jgi:hypothetical protein
LKEREGDMEEEEEEEEETRVTTVAEFCWLRVLCPCWRKEEEQNKKDDWLIAADWVMMRLIIIIIIIIIRRRICPSRDWILLSFLWESVCVCVLLLLCVDPQISFNFSLGVCVTVDPHCDWAELLQHSMHGGFSLPPSLPPSWVLTYLLTYLLTTTSTSQQQPNSSGTYEYLRSLLIHCRLWLTVWLWPHCCSRHKFWRLL